MDLSPLGKGKGGKKGKGKGKGDKSAKPKFCCGKPGHNKNECRNFSAALRKKSVQPDKAGRYAGVEVDPETGKGKSSGGKGTGSVSPAPGMDACLLYENDSDQDVYLFPLPMADESNDSLEDLMALSRQVLFDTGAARSVPNNVQTRCSNRAITRSPPLHQADGTKVAHFGSKFLSIGVGTQKIEGTFDVRNVTEPIVAAGQVTDRGQGVWLNGEGRFKLDVKSARKIENLLGDKTWFCRAAKAERCAYDSLRGTTIIQPFPTGRQGIQMDRGEVDVEEERQPRVTSAPVLPTDRERGMSRGATLRSWCEACVAGRAAEDSHIRSATEPSVPLVAMDYGFLGRGTDVDLATILVLIQRPHGAVGSCLVLRKGPEPYAIDCVLAYLDTWGLREVFKADNEPAIQALVDAVRVRRGERTMGETSPKYSRQSNGAV